MKKYNEFINENLDIDNIQMNNDFYKKYTPFNWKSDGMQILNKLKKPLNDRFDGLNFSINDNDNDKLALIITNQSSKDSYIIIWKFNWDEYEGYLIDINDNIIKSLNDIIVGMYNSGIREI